MSDDSLCEGMFVEFVILVGVIKVYIRRYLLDIFELMNIVWDRSGMFKNMLFLCEEFFVVLNDEFRRSLFMIVFCIVLSFVEVERLRRYDLVLYIFYVLEMFGILFNDYFYLIFLMFVCIFKLSVLDMLFDIKRGVL